VRLTSQVGWGGELRGHPERLRQLLVNLITNALRFSPPGGTVTVGVESQGSTVQIWVDDQGPGIPLEQRELVFEPFWHGPAGHGEAGLAGGAGTGLGLAIARAIALAHGGRLVVSEAPGGGCRMLLGLPQQA
jgi:signal transduction histidine kinase